MSRPVAESRGEVLAAAVRADFELSPGEAALLVEVVRVVDLCDELQGVLDAADGPMLATRSGTRPHPAATELRLQRLVLARLLASMRFPDVEGESRTQRRGIRGVYGIRGAVS